MWGSDAGNARSKGSFSLNADINVTSLVDVAFTLLVIFIITAPILQGGVEVQLPRADAAPITSSEGVIVTVARDGRIYIGDVPVDSPEQFAAVFPEYIRERGLAEAYLRGDRAVPYGRVLRVLGMMKALDVAEVALVAEPLDGGAPAPDDGGGS